MDYRIEEFVMPGEDARGNVTEASLIPRHVSSVALRDEGSPAASPTTAPRDSHVYVVHHDAGRAPVTVYHDDGTEVVELPPQYPQQGSRQRRDEASGQGSSRGIDPEPTDGTTEPVFLKQKKKPGQARKSILHTASS